MDRFNYENIETTQLGGKKTVRKVSIKRGKGTKSITKYHKGKKIHSVKKQIDKHHVHLIKKGKFITGLFDDCKNCKNKKCKHCNTKTKYGGNDDDDYIDLEMGPPEIKQEYMKNVPSDPEAIKAIQAKARVRSITPEQAAHEFALGPAEIRQRRESENMADQDTSRYETARRQMAQQREMLNMRNEDVRQSQKNRDQDMDYDWGKMVIYGNDDVSGGKKNKRRTKKRKY